MDKRKELSRRKFIKQSAAYSVCLSAFPSINLFANDGKGVELVGDASAYREVKFGNADWESLNPGYWNASEGSLRRQLKTVGGRARNTGFPFHYETHRFQSSPDSPVGVMDVHYDPSLPLGIMWSRKWKLAGSYEIVLKGEVKALAHEPLPNDDPTWRMYQPSNGVIGVAIGGKTQFDSFHPHENAPWMAVLEDSFRFGIMRHTDVQLEELGADAIRPVEPLKEGDTFEIEVEVEKEGEQRAIISTRLTVNEEASYSITKATDDPERDTDGYFGIAARGLLDVEITAIDLMPRGNEQLHAPLNECHSCYVLGDTLRYEEERWKVRFVALFRGDGEEAAIRISDEPDPEQGWGEVTPAGRTEIVSNDFRINTAVIDAALPFNPAEKTMYYTVWKDGEDVTGDPRIGTDACGPGTGLVGDVPSSGGYVGRLPQLEAPYKLCGLSCHAIHQNNTSLPSSSAGEGFFVHDQPRYGAYEHLEEFDFQIMLWEDDVWYLELLLYPPSTEDAYKIITTTICGPTTRWQMMRHWNVLNPGDHDHGMDDVKGPEQIVIRNHDDLGQDAEYMARNFQIVSHLMTGKEGPSGQDNPKRWRKWKMPNRDFTLMIMDSRLWRTSQDTNIWGGEGWGHKENLYERTDPTRSLLGEEQFAWLQETIRTDSSNIICLTGINGLHTIWAGSPYGQPRPWPEFDQRDRVAADYAGWVAAGADRVIELLGERSGVVSVYGDVHNGSIVKNSTHSLYECSFGPIGRYGGRTPVEGFGPRMQDYDGRSLEAIALYHADYKSVDLEANDGPKYWNFLEMSFDPSVEDPVIELKIRNLVDRPADVPRGDGHVETTSSETGRSPLSTIPRISTLPDADIQFMSMEGDPIRGCHSLPDGTLPKVEFTNIHPGSSVILLARNNDNIDSQIVDTVGL